MREGQLKFIIKMRDEASARLKQVTRELKQTANAAKDTGTGLGAAAVGMDAVARKAGGASIATANLGRSMGVARGAALGLVGILASLGASLSFAVGLNSVIEFGQRMSVLRGVTQATDDQFSQLRDKAIQLGESTAYSAGQAAQGLELLAKGGLNIQQTLQASQAALDLAAAGELNLDESAAIITSVMASYQLAATDAVRVTDILSFAANTSSTDVRELGEAIKYAGSTASAFGVDLEETNLALAALADRGIKASMAGTSLRGVLTRLNAPSSKLEAFVAKLGLSMEDVETKSEGLLPVLRKLQAAGAENRTSDIFLAFGDRAGPALMNLLGSLDKIDSYMLAQTKSTEQATNALTYFLSTGERVGNRGRVTETLKELTVLTDETRKRLTAVGADLSRFDPADGLVGAIDALRTADPAKVIAEFGETTGRVLLKLAADFNTSGVAIGAYTKDLDGFNARVSAMAQNNLGGAFDRLSSSLDSLFIRLNQDQSGPLRSFIETLGFTAQFLGAGEAAMDGIRQSAKDFGMQADVVEKNVRALAKGIEYLVGALAGLAIVFAVTTGVGLLTAAAAFLLTPVGAVAAAIAGLTAFLYANRDATVETADGYTTWGDIVAVVFETVTGLVGDLWGQMQDFFGAVGDYFSDNGTSVGAWANIMWMQTKVVGNAFYALGASIPDIFTTAFNAVGRLFEDFGREVSKELMKPIVAAQQAAAGDFAGALVTAQTGGGNFKAVIDGQFEEMAALKTRIGERYNEDVMGQMASGLFAGLDAITEKAAARTKARAEVFLFEAKDAVARANDAVRDITLLGDKNLAEGNTAAYEAVQGLIQQAQDQAWKAQEAMLVVMDAVGKGNVKLASDASKRAIAAANAAEGTLSTGTIPGQFVPDDEFAEDPTAPTADEIASAQKAEQFRTKLAETVAGINARTAALTQDANTQRLWNAVTGLGLDLTQEYAADSKEAAALVQIENALKGEGIAIDEAKLRTLGLETEYIRAQIDLRALSGSALAQETAVLEERLRLARENNLATLAEADAYMKAEAAIRGVAAANYDLGQVSMTATQGAQSAWEEWSKKVMDVGGSIKDVVGSSLTQLGSTMTSFLLGQEANWASFANSVISMIMEIIVQMLIMQGIKSALGAFGVTLPFAEGGVPGTAFAKGSAFANSVVSSPTTFKFAKGGSPRIGVMGEAGPEAIMPLKRMGSGNLGVEVSGGGGGYVINAPVTINMQGSGSPETDRRSAEMAADMVKGIIDQRFGELIERQQRSSKRLGR